MCVCMCMHVYAQVCIYPRVPHPELRRLFPGGSQEAGGML